LIIALPDEPLRDTISHPAGQKRVGTLCCTPGEKDLRDRGEKDLAWRYRLERF